MSDAPKSNFKTVFASGRGLLDEFKAFISKGSVIQLAVGIVIGAAFAKVVEAFSKGIIEPLLAVFSKSGDLSFLDFWGFKFSMVLSAVITFLITAAVVFFIIIKPMNKLMDMITKKEEEKPAELSEEILLLREIRDSLKKKIMRDWAHENSQDSREDERGDAIGEGMALSGDDSSFSTKERG